MGRNGFNKSFQSSKEIKLNEINFNKKYGEIVTTALTCCVITLFGLALGFAFYNLIHNFIGKTKE
jgi:CRISPR/Cas system CMR-associated protein Cmr5 small subunit